MKFWMNAWIMGGLLMFVLGGCEQVPGPHIPESERVGPVVPFAVETEAVLASEGKDAADDPAIWYNAADPARSIIVGSNKTQGIELYNLAGKRLQFYPSGRINNVDVAYGFPYQGRQVDLMAGSNRTDNSIDWYTITADTMHFLHKTPSQDLEEVYGFCLYQSPNDGQFYAFVNDKTGLVEQYRITANAEGKVSTERVRTLKAPSQVEGMVADRTRALVYVGVEEGGILCFGADPGASTEGRLLEGSTNENPNIAYDIEGLTMYHGPDGEGYLLASSQGNHSYAVFRREPPNAYLGSFHIGTEAEATKDTDGIAVTGRNLGGAFTGGLLVCQDGYNYDGQQHIPQNFKLVQWTAVEKLIEGF